MPTTLQPTPLPEPRIGILEDWLTRTEQAVRAKGQLGSLSEARGQVRLSWMTIKIWLMGVDDTDWHSEGLALSRQFDSEIEREGGEPLSHQEIMREEALEVGRRRRECVGKDAEWEYQIEDEMDEVGREGGGGSGSDLTLGTSVQGDVTGILSATESQEKRKIKEDKKKPWVGGEGRRKRKAAMRRRKMEELRREPETKTEGGSIA
ncbi:hypothetical protein L873DRAFT_1791700 [Choiromyces venosus 120613-1]|uniref:Uncharacterized protein n=1 Tax=Choiromyces venosus 120613-1 TaxID=1336337 RepID=A0A3N4JH98_9PEZI|nr:hypothetical protein L873DRAFT_1791700 [Choiromyces venosus 120613-1]